MNIFILTIFFTKNRVCKSKLIFFEIINIQFLSLQRHFKQDKRNEKDYKTEN